MLDHEESLPATGLSPEQSKACNACREIKPVAAFPSLGLGKRRSTCSECHNSHRRSRGDSARRRLRETPEERRSRLLWEMYRLTSAQYAELLAAQGDACAICRKAPGAGKPLAVDHCHTTGAVRALLCNHCNLMVGTYETHRQAAAEYLAAYGAGNPLLSNCSAPEGQATS